jgi:hypothetical protein
MGSAHNSTKKRGPLPVSAARAQTSRARGVRGRGRRQQWPCDRTGPSSRARPALDAASALATRALQRLRSLGSEDTEVAGTYLVLAELAELRGNSTLAAELLAHAQRGAFGAGLPMELRDQMRMADLAEAARRNGVGRSSAGSVTSDEVAMDAIEPRWALPPALSRHRIELISTIVLGPSTSTRPHVG